MPMATEERCVQSDLPKSMCSHCRPASEPTIEESRITDFGALLAKSVQGKWFTANYSGDCSICGERFERGEEIRADGSGGWQGRDCCGDD